MDESKLKSVCRQEADSVRPGRVFCAKMSWRIFWKGVALYLTRPAAQFKFATSFVLIIVMMSGGVSAYAYDSPDVNSANFLYPVKQGLEGIEGKFKFSPQDKIRFHVKVAKRRLQETESMKERLDHMMNVMIRPVPPPHEIERLNRAIEQTMLRIESEVDTSIDLTDTDMSKDEALKLLRDMQDEFAVMHNHMGMMRDGKTLEQIHERMENRLQLMKDGSRRVTEMAPMGKRIRLREFLMTQEAD